MIVISDTSVIINLAIINQLDLLPQLFGIIVIPQAVYNEIVFQGKGLPGSKEINEASWIEVRMIQDLHLYQSILEEDLDPGESEAITLAIELQADRILMDEALGRELAIRLHLKPIGVLGILLEAKHNGLIPVIRPFMDDLINNARFFIGQTLYDRVLQLAGE